MSDHLSDGDRADIEEARAESFGMFDPELPQNHDAWLEQIAVPCSKCGAAVGAPCVNDRGAEIRGAHNARKNAAR